MGPVLKVDAHGAHVRRTKESWEDQKRVLHLVWVSYYVYVVVEVTLNMAR